MYLPLKLHRITDHQHHPSPARCNPYHLIFHLGRQLRNDIQRLTDQVALHPPHLNTPASGFSGGNQQKIVLAKGLYSEADIYIFVEPTVGVDIGARAKIYGLMRELSERAAVIVVSSDCDEVHGVADRTIALHKGRQVEPESGVFSRDDLLMAGIMGEGSL